MSDQSEFEKDLGELLAKGQVCVVVGFGVSVGTTQNAPAASWPGLLRLGAKRPPDSLGEEREAAWLEISHVTRRPFRLRQGTPPK